MFDVAARHHVLERNVLPSKRDGVDDRRDESADDKPGEEPARPAVDRRVALAAPNASTERNRR